MLDSVLRGHPGAKRARGLAALRLDWSDVASRTAKTYRDIMFNDR